MIISKEKLNAIEETFVTAIRNMDTAVADHNNEKATQYAFEACAVANVLGIMRGTCEDEATEYLYNKYNLHKAEEKQPTYKQYPTLTELEKEVLVDALDEGYAYDCGNKKFLCWGFSESYLRKGARGAVSSLVKKGVIDIFKDGGDTYVNCGKDYDIGDIEKMAGVPQRWHE